MTVRNGVLRGLALATLAACSSLASSTPEGAGRATDARPALLTSVVKVVTTQSVQQLVKGVTGLVKARKIDVVQGLARANMVFAGTAVTRAAGSVAEARAAADAGCWVRGLVPVRAWLSLPPVFAASALYDNLLQAALRQFFSITVPQLKYTIITSSTLMVVGSLTFFDLIFVLTEGGPGDATRVLALDMYKRGFQANLMGPASVIAEAPPTLNQTNGSATRKPPRSTTS